MSGLWSVALRAALDAFGSLGLDAAAIAREAGVSEGQLDDPDARIPLAISGAIWPAAAKRWGRPGLGLWAGSALVFGKLQALDYALATAATVGDGLARMSRYWEVVTAGLTGARVVRGRREAPTVLELTGYAMPDLRDYAVAGSVVRLGIVGVMPESITLAGPPVTSAREYVSKLGCEVVLDAAATTLRLPAGSYERVVPQRFPGLRSTVDREMDRLLATARTAGDPLADVRREVTTLLGPEPPTLASVARRLGLSTRQLQRRIADRGSSFKSILADARRALAEFYVEDGALGVAEIAYLLGYSEPAAFSRAFKRWTGQAPEHRRRRRG